LQHGNEDEEVQWKNSRGREFRRPTTVCWSVWRSCLNAVHHAADRWSVLSRSSGPDTTRCWTRRGLLRPTKTTTTTTMMMMMMTTFHLCLRPHRQRCCRRGRKAPATPTVRFVANLLRSKPYNKLYNKTTANSQQTECCVGNTQQARSKSPTYRSPTNSCTTNPQQIEQVELAVQTLPKLNN